MVIWKMLFLAISAEMMPRTPDFGILANPVYSCFSMQVNSKLFYRVIMADKNVLCTFSSV